MKNWIKKVLGFEGLPQDISYEKAREILEKHNRTARKELAERDDTPPEMLYYLSDDEEKSVRSAVAANDATPIQASERLVNDPEDDVRTELARRIGRLLPGADENMQADLRDRVVNLLEKLAADKLVRVRAIIAEEIKAASNVPDRVVKLLARDKELSVCGPVLEYSPLLSDADLMELIAGSAVNGAAEAIARRSNVNEDLAAAIANTLDIPAVTALLSNPNVQIREDTLDLIITEAVELEALHEPLAMRPHLSLRAVRRIASFVARSLLEKLSERSDLDEETQKELRTRVLGRIEAETGGAERADQVLTYVRKAFEEGTLDDRTITKLTDTGDLDGVVLALSLLTSQPVAKIDEVIEAQSAEAVTAVCWRAGLSMRTAHAVQRVVRIPHNAMVLPKGGFEYPMDEDKMLLQLNFFGFPDGS